VLIILKQSSRSFVDKLDFITSVGHGEAAIRASAWACRVPVRSASSPTCASWSRKRHP
jgi:glutaconate CoA-transferase subunit B